jgi:hypothetical protein
MATMQSFFEWFGAKGIDQNQPWLILGKGPSFSKRKELDLKPYHTMSLNHVVREQAVTVAHMIDYDVVDACGEAILTNTQYLVLPWFPHVNNRPGRRNLEELARTNTVLRKLNEQGRLLWYNHSRARERRGDSPVVRVRFFSAEAALNLLARAGVRKIRSLGVDGGAAYSQDFDDLKDKTLLVNDRKSFDDQFEEIAKIIMTTGIDYAPLDVGSPIRVYVGATEAQMLPVKVLEYSIRKHTSMSVEVFPLHLSGVEIPTPLDPKNRPRTPFSFQRFLIPVLSGYQGRAIYLDSDMQAFKDIRTLWTLPLNGADLLTTRAPEVPCRRAQFSVMLLNCDSLRWDIDEIIAALNKGQMNYEQLIFEMAVAENISFDIDGTWNSLEMFSGRKTALLHFTDMDIQPWVSRRNPLNYLWMRDLFEAIDAGVVSFDFVKQHVRQDYLRPSLLYQVEHRIEDSFLLPKEARSLDKDFIPPHRTVPTREGSPWLHPAKLLRAAVRHQRSRMLRFQRGLRQWFQDKDVC